MAVRSLRASAEGIQIIRKAIKRDGWKQEELKEELGLKTRQPITRLLAGEPIERPTFEELCHLLGIEVQDVAVPEAEESQPNLEVNIDRLVEEVRDRIQPQIQQACGTMRVLDMSYPIGLNDIYTDVNILERITSRRGLEWAEMMREAGHEQFDRFCLGDVREQRVPALEAVRRFDKLMILGKPGAGKTTFLKRLAMQCIGGKVMSDRVPVFVTLKEFAEFKGQPDLLDYLDRWAGLSLGAIVQAGKALILLDGLDEVREVDSDRVLRQIKAFSQQFSQNCFVITCRIAAREYTYEQFTEVEVADFDDTQIAEFSNNWFRSRNDAAKAERFLARLTKDEPIRELAASPLLLTLLCLVFEDSGDFPTNRAELYQNGVDVLLKKWDVKRNIERDRVYKGLSLKRKEALLGQIARKTFEAGNYFFKQREAERYISEYIQNLPDASTDPEALEVDSAAVLKSIEAHHGLLIERARNIYSFSHLTFHEYFVACKIFASCNQHATDDPTLQALANHITENRWREVIVLTVGMLESADCLLQMMKCQIDELLTIDDKLQDFLAWVEKKSELAKGLYKPASVRACAFACALARDCAIARNLARTRTLACARTLARDRELDFNLDFALALNMSLVLDLDQNGAHHLARDYELPRNLNRELQHKLQQLKEQIPETNNETLESFNLWWQASGQTWTEQLRAVLIENRNTEDNWQFSNVQEKLLQKYYYANWLLAICLNSDCYVSREVRQEIEETLLLPIAEIEAWKQNKGRS